MPTAVPGQTATPDLPVAPATLLSKCKRALTPQRLFVCRWSSSSFLCPVSIGCIPQSPTDLRVTSLCRRSSSSPRTVRHFTNTGLSPTLFLPPTTASRLRCGTSWAWLKPPYSSYPFGFANPLVQMNLLIIEGRSIFMVLCLWSALLLVRRMARLSSSWLLITVVSVALLASNYNYNAILSSTRPDASG